MTDKQLFYLCKKYGADALAARRKFAGLLPEVYKRRLYEKRGFESIYVFAAKLAGMSRRQVDLVLRLERRFEDKPVLKEALVSGKVSPNKLVRIAPLVTEDNQSELVERAKQYSSRALEVFVKDINGSIESKKEQKSMHLIRDYEAIVAAQKLLFEYKYEWKDMHDHFENSVLGYSEMGLINSDGKNFHGRHPFFFFNPGLRSFQFGSGEPSRNGKFRGRGAIRVL